MLIYVLCYFNMKDFFSNCNLSENCGMIYTTVTFARAKTVHSLKDTIDTIQM